MVLVIRRLWRRLVAFFHCNPCAVQDWEYFGFRWNNWRPRWSFGGDVISKIKLISEKLATLWTSRISDKLHWYWLVLSFLLNFSDCGLASFSGHNLAQLLLSDCVVRIWNQILSYFGQCKGYSGVTFGRRPDSRYFNVQVVVEVRVFRISSLS